MGTEVTDPEPPVDDASLAAELDHPGADEIELGDVLHALSDPMRLRIVADLSDGVERTCKSFDLPVVKSTCTHHFRVLREAGVIRQRLEGTTKLNSLRREDLDGRFPGLLDAVLEAAETPQPRRRSAPRPFWVVAAALIEDRGATRLPDVATGENQVRVEPVLPDMRKTEQPFIRSGFDAGHVAGPRPPFLRTTERGYSAREHKPGGPSS